MVYVLFAIGLVLTAGLAVIGTILVTRPGVSFWVGLAAMTVGTLGFALMVVNFVTTLLAAGVHPLFIIIPALIIAGVLGFLAFRAGASISDRAVTGLFALIFMLAAVISFIYWLKQPADTTTTTPTPKATEVVVSEGTSVPEGTEVTTEAPKTSTIQIPECKSFNGDWKAFLGTDGVYTLDPENAAFASMKSSFMFYEGELANLPDTHQVFEFKAPVKSLQQNIWYCPSPTPLSNEQKDAILQLSAGYAWRGWNGQANKPFHPIIVTTPLGVFPYAKGEKTRWVLENGTGEDQACQYSTPSLQDPGGVLQADGSYVGAPGIQGCDFIEVQPNGKAFRYSGRRDSFPYEFGTKFFVFDPSLSNEAVATALNIGAISSGK